MMIAKVSSASFASRSPSQDIAYPSASGTPSCETNPLPPRAMSVLDIICQAPTPIALTCHGCEGPAASSQPVPLPIVPVL
eukprot:1121598-Rhodomonas_salina.1